MSAARVDHLELLRATRQSAGDLRKVFLTLYGLLITVPLALLLVATWRTILLGGFREQAVSTLLWPVQSTTGFFAEAFSDGRWGLMAMLVLAVWLVSLLVGSFFGLAVTRMAAIELTCRRRAEVGEALRFARGHWHWGFLTPAGLVFGAMLLTGTGAALMALGRISGYLVVVTAPCAFVLVVGAVILVIGLVAGGILARPAISTEWSDAFDAITRVYGYSFTHSYRVLVYRVGAGLTLLGAVVTRGFRALLVLVCFYVALLVGFGREQTTALLNAVLLEPAQGLPFPQTVAGWTLVTCVAVFLTFLLARLLVYRLVMRQAVYLLLRLKIDKVPFDNIDGYRPDDSAYDPTAQGFELVEVEEEIVAG